MTKNLKKYILFGMLSLVTFLGLVFNPASLVHAEDVKFSVTPIYPSNQIDSAAGYYKLKVTPGMEEQVQLAIQNTDNKKIRLKVTPNAAITNANGSIDYSNSTKKPDRTLQYPLNKLFSGAQTVTVDANSKKVVSFSLKAPQETFSGQILGGFYVVQLDKQTSTPSQNDKAVGLTNQISYVTGIQLISSETMPAPELKLNQVRAGLRNGHTALLANLQNIEANTIGEIKVKTEVRRADQKKILFKSSNSGMSMAPNSNFDYAIGLQDQAIQAGKYHLDMTVDSNKGKWHFSKDFTITAKDAKYYNSKAVGQTNPNWLLYSLIALLILIIIGLIILLFRRRNKDNSTNN